MYMVNKRSDTADKLIVIGGNPTICRCGTYHFGDYAEEEYRHHECFHRATLLHIGDGHLICEDCGEDFYGEDMSEGYGGPLPPSN